MSDTEPPAQDFAEDLSDKESDALSDLASELDDDEFKEFDPAAATISADAEPQEIDEDAARTLKASKRRTDGDAATSGSKKKEKEVRRPKKKRPRDDDAGDGEFDAAAGSAGDKSKKRARRVRADGEAAVRTAAKPVSPEPEEVPDELLTEEQRKVKRMNALIQDAIRSRGRAVPRQRKRADDDTEVRTPTSVPSRLKRLPAKTSNLPFSPM